MVHVLMQWFGAWICYICHCRGEVVGYYLSCVLLLRSVSEYTVTFFTFTSGRK
jgi:hypothetical protein